MFMPREPRTRSRLAASIGALLCFVAMSIGSGVVAATPTWGAFGPVTFGNVGFGPDGTPVVADCGNARIYSIAPNGSVSILAGAGPGGFSNGYSGDGWPAIDAHFGCPVGLLADVSGNLLVTDHLNDVIRRIDPAGTVTTIVGAGPLFKWSPGAWVPGVGKHAGDGGPALAATLDAPWRFNFDRAGNLYIADRDHDAIRKIDQSGIITTIAGTGVRGFSGDGGPAIDARLNRPLDVAFDGAGRMLVADENNSRIRRIALDGTITTIAGTGELGCGGDGGQAAAAAVQNVNSIDIGSDGSVYLTEGECHRVRVIHPDGTIGPVLGSGVEGCSGFEGGLATTASLTSPGSLRLDGHGILFVTDDTCNVLLAIDRAGRVHLIADAATAGI